MKLPSKNEIRKPTKTLAGVTPIAVMLKPRKCRHGTCLYCPSLNVPQSYTPLSPPVIRAEMLNYNPYEQVKSRLKAFKLMNHPTDKIELIIMGGTFLSYPPAYQSAFIKACYDALNKRKSKNLDEAKKLNEKARHRCVALCIETRPDFCSEKEIKKILEFGATRVEIGVQAIDNRIYKKVNRGHKVKDVVQATEKLKQAGFKIGYHMMLGLPGSNMKKDFQMFKKIFSSSDFKPDQLKIYPCQVIKGAKLVENYEKGKYTPYTKEQIESLLIKIFKIIPNYCRIMRIMREIPPEFLIAGTKRIDLRKPVEEKLRRMKIKINEIRFREIGFNPVSDFNLMLKITKYKASGGDEYFLELVNKDNILFGLLRLMIERNRKVEKTEHKTRNKVEQSIESREDKQLTEKNKKQTKAIIREVHIYGKSIQLGKKGKLAKKTVGVHAQHKGLGKQLIKKAEQIAENEKADKIFIISGIGARQYYKKLGYKLENNYMVKSISKSRKP